MSLRAKLTLWFGLVIAVSLAVFGALNYRSLSNQLTTGLDVALEKAVAALDAKGQEVAVEAQMTPRERQQRNQKSRTQNDTSQPEVEYFRDQDTNKQASGQNQALQARTSQQVPGETKPGSKGVDGVYASITEYVVLNPRNFMVQVMDSAGTMPVYRSPSLGLDTLQVPQDVLLLADTTETRFVTFTNKSRNAKGEMKEQSIRAAVARSRSVILVVAYPYDELQSSLDDFLRTLMWLIPVVLLVSTIGGWFFARASLQPVDELTSRAQDITANNLSLRLPVKGSNDEIKRLTETLNDMISRLESSFGQIRQFTADASHELRTPLTILTGELELALRSARTEEEYQEVISSALQETLRMSHVVEDLLLLSRADMGRVSLKTDIVNLNEMLADLADATSILGTKKDLVITYRHENRTIFVEGDAPRLYQMLLNLLDNAVKYTPQGGAITLTLHSDGDVAEIRVRDTGIGIIKEHQSKIFDRFYRVDKARSRAQGGVGLGLSIVEWTIRAHNGTISVDSEPGVGSTFIVRIPRLRDEALPPPGPQGTDERHHGIAGALDHLPKFLKRRHSPGEVIDGEEPNGTAGEPDEEKMVVDVSINGRRDGEG